MDKVFDIEKLLNTDISPYLNKDYIDMLNKKNELIDTYNEVYENVSHIMDKDLFADLYDSHMAMAAAFDSSRLGIKGIERAEILKQSYKKKYRSIENHINILKDKEFTFTVNNILSMYRSLINENGEFRTLPKYRNYGSGKLLCSTNVEKDLEMLMKFINDPKFGNYTLVNVVLTQLAILSIAPFNRNNEFISITLADKLIEKHYGKPIFMETILYRIKGEKGSMSKELRKFWRTGDFSSLMKIYTDSMMIEMESNMVFLRKLEKDIVELDKLLKKTNIKAIHIPKLIRFLILNNTFKIRDLYNKLDITDRRTVIKITDELEKLGIISNVSDSRVKLYVVQDKWHNDFKLMYKIK